MVFKKCITCSYLFRYVNFIAIFQQINECFAQCQVPSILATTNILLRIMLEGIKFLGNIFIVIDPTWRAVNLPL